MSGSMIISVFTLILVRTDCKVICDATEAKRGSPSNITCHFGDDISRTKQPFGVDRYHGDTPSVVLRCHWSNESEVPICDHTEGYHFDPLVTNTLTLHIPSTTKKYVGRYVCQVLTKHQKNEACNLKLKQNVSNTTVTCDATDVKRGSPSNITCHFGDDIGRTKRPFGIDGYHGDTPRAVLRCHWSNENEVPICANAEGYHFDLMVTNTLTLNVWSTTEEYVGNYTCQVLTSHQKIQPCNLRIKPNVTERPEAKEGGLKLPLIIGITVTTVVLSIAVGVVIVVFRRKHFCENGSTSQENGELRCDYEIPMVQINHQNGNSTVTAPDETAPMLSSRSQLRKLLGRNYRDVTTTRNLPAQQNKPEHWQSFPAL